jgi:hypothetical protein
MMFYHYLSWYLRQVNLSDLSILCIKYEEKKRVEGVFIKIYSFNISYRPHTYEGIGFKTFAFTLKFCISDKKYAWCIIYD